MDTKSQAIETGKALLQLKGFNGFSFQDIADELGIRKASLHYHFSSKEELGLALIADYEDAFSQWCETVQELDPMDQLEKFCLIFYRISQDNLKICPTGVFCSDYNTLPTSMQKRLGQFHKTQSKWLEKTITAARKDKDVTKALSPKELASLILANIQGSLQLARMNENASFTKNNAANLLKLLET